MKVVFENGQEMCVIAWVQVGSVWGFCTINLGSRHQGTIQPRLCFQSMLGSNKLSRMFLCGCWCKVFSLDVMIELSGDKQKTKRPSTMESVYHINVLMFSSGYHSFSCSINKADKRPKKIFKKQKKCTSKPTEFAVRLNLNLRSDYWYVLITFLLATWKMRPSPSLSVTYTSLWMICLGCLMDCGFLCEGLESDFPWQFKGCALLHASRVPRLGASVLHVKGK